MKKLLMIILSFAAALTLFAACTPMETPSGNPGNTGGGGTGGGGSNPPPVGAVVEIRTEDDLFAMSNNLNGSYKLMNDITLTKPWKAIGTSQAPFTGVFDGSNFTLTNVVVESDILEVDDTSIDYMIGMFGVLKGDIKRLKVNALTINVSQTTVQNSSYATLLSQNGDVTDLTIHAGLVGANKGNIENVTLNVDYDIVPQTASARVRVGGVAGKSNDKIADCSVSGDVNVTTSDGYIRAGGVAGYVSSNGKVKGNKSTANITATITTGAKIQLGGIVGNIECGIIEDCFATGDLVGVNTASKSSVAGGIVGQIDNTEYKYEDMSVTVNACYSTANVAVTGTKGYAAGLIGQVDFNYAVIVTGNACSGTILGVKGTYGFIGRMQTALGVLLTTGDFTNGVYNNLVTVSGNSSVTQDSFATKIDSLTVPEKFN
ncbi:MAG: hypothetical protein J6B04_02645 [Clostridia bacterium]|nr:hypothetical protein [Clostridia bacterium]